MHSSLASKLSSAKLPPPMSSSSKKQRALRFTIDLELTGKNTYTHFSLKKMIQEKKQKNKLQKQKDNNFRPPNPFGDEDSDEEVARIAAQFEQKYGYDADGYIDRGEGYDLEDPFVDNSEAYDELIPDYLTTEHGGFYINCGELSFKTVSNDKPEDDYQKASLLQKLKRKHNKLEDDIEVDKHRKHKTKPPKQPSSSTPIQQQPKSPKPSIKDGSNKKIPTNHQQQPNNTGFVPNDDNYDVMMTDDSKTNKVHHEPKIKDHSSKTGKKNLDSNSHPAEKIRKSSKNISSTPSPTTISTTSTSNQLSSAAVSLAQNFYSTKIQQMITDSLFGNLPPATSGASNSSSNSAASLYSNFQQAAAVQNLTLLKTNLLNLKIPYDIVQAIPLAKPTTMDGLISPEWNRYLIEVYKKSSSSTKTRAKIYEYLAKYVGGAVTGETLQNYAQRMEATTNHRSSSSSSSSSTSKKPTISNSGGYTSKSNSPSPSLQQQQNSYNPSKSSKQSSDSRSSPVQAINLSTSSQQPAQQSSTFSEGLAGKLMVTNNNHQTNETSNNPANNSNKISSNFQQPQQSSRSLNSPLPLTTNNLKITNSSSNNSKQTNKLNKPDVAAFGMTNHGLTLLQSLACLASSSSSPTSTSFTSSSGVSSLILPQKSPSPSTSTTPSMPPPSQSLLSSSTSASNRSTTPPMHAMPRSTSVPNPNSLLAAFAATNANPPNKPSSNVTSPSNQIKTSTPTSSPANTSTPSSNRPDILSSLFQIPNMFTNANLINHFLSTSPSSTSTSSPTSTQSIAKSSNNNKIPSSGMISPSSSSMATTARASISPPNSSLMKNQSSSLLMNNNNSLNLKSSPSMMPPSTNQTKPINHNQQHTPIQQHSPSNQMKINSMMNFIQNKPNSSPTTTTTINSLMGLPNPNINR